jgi:hypothetical protein
MKGQTQTKVLDAVQLIKTMTELHGFDEAFNKLVMSKFLPA